MKKIILIALAAVLLLSACGRGEASSDEKMRDQQERLAQEGNAQAGMPAIKNFREKKILKMIYEMRDQENLATYTYIVAEQTGKIIFVGESVGFAIPASTQYTNPQKPAYAGAAGIATLPQADPNGMFSPASAEGSWVLMKDPGSDKVRPVYFEPRIIVSPFKLKNAQY